MGYMDGDECLVKPITYTSEVGSCRTGSGMKEAGDELDNVNSLAECVLNCTN